MRWISRPAATVCARCAYEGRNRLFASEAAKRPKSRFGPTVSLEHFLQRSKVLSLWRRVLRDTKRIADLQTRAETRKMARDEFERNKNVTDISQIKYLISTGKSQWDATERFFTELRTFIPRTCSVTVTAPLFATVTPAGLVVPAAVVFANAAVESARVGAAAAHFVTAAAAAADGRSAVRAERRRRGSIACCAWVVGGRIAGCVAGLAGGAG
ncbi:hypothetical protein V494_03188, partial [Pseudogymnoascus sp. VKM F-4513 (FW-928)]